MAKILFKFRTRQTFTSQAAQWIFPNVRKFTGMVMISSSFCCRSPFALTDGQPLDSI